MSFSITLKTLYGGGGGVWWFFLFFFVLGGGYYVEVLFFIILNLLISLSDERVQNMSREKYFKIVITNCHKHIFFQTVY